MSEAGASPARTGANSKKRQDRKIEDRKMGLRHGHHVGVPLAPGLRLRILPRFIFLSSIFLSEFSAS
jgi:hypothetical protein